MTVPAARPVFHGFDAFNDAPDSAFLARKIAGWLSHAYDTELRCTPCDPAAYWGSYAPGASGFDAACKLSQWVYTYGNPYPVPQNWFGTAYLPPPSSSDKAVLKVHLCIRLEDDTSTGAVFLDDEQGRRYEIPFSRAAGLPAGGGWLSAATAISPLSRILSIGAGTSSTSAAWLLGMCAYWTFPEANAFIAPYYAIQTAAAFPDGYSDSVHGLAWLVRMAGEFRRTHQPMAIAKWWGRWRSSEDSGSPYGTYFVRLAPHVTSLRMRVLARASSGSGRIFAYTHANATPDAGELAAAVYTGTVLSTTTHSWKTLTLPVTAGTEARDLWITIDAEPGAQWEIATVEVDEVPPSSSYVLATGDTLAPSFPVLAEPVADGAIVGSERRALVDAMKWLWAKRSARYLVHDCRWNALDSYNINPAFIPLSDLDVNGGSSTTLVQSRYGFYGTSDGLTKPDVVLRFGLNRTREPVATVPATSRYAEAGVAGYINPTRSARIDGVSHRDANPDTGAIPLRTWLSFDQQGHLASGGYFPLDGSYQPFSIVQSGENFLWRVSGLVVEEARMSSPDPGWAVNEDHV